VEFRILGPLEVVDQGRPVPLGGARQRALLALLLTRANEVVSTERLIDELWGARPPATAANALQYHVSRLRKALAPSEAIVTEQRGYLIRVGPDELDVLRFERLLEQAEQSPPEVATELLRQALDLWRGPALGDLAQESFAGVEFARLEELRLIAVERRIEAELALGRHAEVVADLEAFVREHPLRERFRAQLMLALYRSGRQVEALGVYRAARRQLVEELGIEPGPDLQELERAILRQDPELAPPATSLSPPQQAILVVADDATGLDASLAIAEPLARRPRRELILAQFLPEDARLAAATAALAARRRALSEHGIASRIAAYTTVDPGAEAAQLAGEHDIDLVLVAPSLRELGRLESGLATMLDQVACDVGVVVRGERVAGGPVVTPFGGAEHDWSAIEIAAWLAASLDTTLRLIGTEAEPALGRRDASRLLARASLLVQQVIGIVTEPVLVPAGPEGVLAAAENARLLVVGLSDRWRSEGIGSTRLSLAAAARIPTLFVRRGTRPGGFGPPEPVTRFAWTPGSQHVGSPS
jgi:DNA-binding SARP family transcriptional activator